MATGAAGATVAAAVGVAAPLAVDGPAVVEPLAGEPALVAGPFVPPAVGVAGLRPVVLPEPLAAHVVQLPAGHVVERPAVARLVGALVLVVGRGLLPVAGAAALRLVV